jgi:hypothetical protein
VHALDQAVAFALLCSSPVNTFARVSRT